MRRRHLATTRLAARGALSALAIGVAALLVARDARAQSCLGLPDSVRATVGATTDRDSRSQGFGARFALINRSTFATVGTSSIQYRDLDARATVVNASFGGMSRVQTVSRARLCPVAAVGYVVGPAYRAGTSEIRNRAITASGALAVSLVLDVNPTFTVLPFARFSVQHQQRTQETRRASGVVTRGSGTSIGGTAGGGIGFRFNDRLTITPAFSAPVGYDGLSALVSLGATFGFGRPLPPRPPDERDR